MRGRSEAGALSRRDLLRAVAGTAAAALVGSRRDDSGAGEPAARSPADAGQAPPCIVRPRQTEGPYFVDEQLRRSDIRSDPSDGSVRPGVPLRLSLQLSRMDGRACTPLPNVAVDLWHCDAEGVYSDVLDGNGLFDTRGRKFLRGYQLTNDKGIAEFLTIYPGWYEGRTVHIHFKLRTDPSSRRGYEFTSQLYFDESVTDRVQTQAPYAGRGRRMTTNEMDGIFRRGGNRLMLDLTPEAQGYTAIFPIGLEIK